MWKSFTNWNGKLKKPIYDVTKFCPWLIYISFILYYVPISICQNFLYFSKLSFATFFLYISRFILIETILWSLVCGYLTVFYWVNQVNQTLTANSIRVDHLSETGQSDYINHSTCQQFHTVFPAKSFQVII